MLCVVTGKLPPLLCIEAGNLVPMWNSRPDCVVPAESVNSFKSSDPVAAGS